MSIIRRHFKKKTFFVKTRERLQKEQAVIQAVEKPSTENNEQELLASALLLLPQQSSGLGTWDYEAVVESMTNVKNTKSRGSYTKFTDVDLFRIERCAGGDGSKKALIYFEYEFPELKESAVRTFKKQFQEDPKTAIYLKWWLSKVINGKKWERPLLLDGLDKMI